MTQRVTDLNGYTLIPRNPISRVGVFPYSGRSIGAQADQADKIFMVYRPESELSDPETLESFKLAPWTDDHAMLGDPALQDGLINPEDKGVHGTLGEQIEYDPTTRTLYANLKLWSSKLGALINAGKKELSCGFRCVYEFTQGNFEGTPFDAIQRTIRANHLASVPEGRMGPGVAVLDHLTFTFDAKELKMKVTRRVALAKKLSVAPAALAAAVGMDAADPATLAKWNTAMDAEDPDSSDDTDAGTGVTLEDIAAMLENVGPALASINAAAAAIAGGAAPASTDDPDAGAIDDGMEAVVDANGAPVMDPATGKQKRAPKAAPAAAAADATPPALAAMDASLATLKATAKAIRGFLPAGKAAPAGLVAMDAAITTAEKALAKARTPRRVSASGMDALERRLAAAEAVIASSTGAPAFQSFMAAAAQRDALYGKASAIIGAFDCKEMDTVAVAKYTAGKLGIAVQDGQEVLAVENYLAGRLANPTPAAVSAFGLDASAGGDADTLAFLAGKPARTAA